MQNDPLSEKRSLELIEEMIQTAKQEQVGSAYYFVLWGIITFVYAISMYIAVVYNIGWLSYSWVLFLVGALLSILRTRRDERVEKAKSLTDRVYGYVWGATGFFICVVLTFGLKIGSSNIVPLMILIYALASFITGGVTKYLPSVYSSFICGVCAIFAFCFELKYQLLLYALAILCTHIIPGLMMKNYYKRKLNAE